MPKELDCFDLMREQVMKERESGPIFVVVDFSIYHIKGAILLLEFKHEDNWDISQITVYRDTEDLSKVSEYLKTARPMSKKCFDTLKECSQMDQYVYTETVDEVREVIEQFTKRKLP